MMKFEIVEAGAIVPYQISWWRVPWAFLWWFTPKSQAVRLVFSAWVRGNPVVGTAEDLRELAARQEEFDMRTRAEMEEALAATNARLGSDLRIEWSGNAGGCLMSGSGADLLTMTPLMRDEAMGQMLRGFDGGVRFALEFLGGRIPGVGAGAVPAAELADRDFAEVQPGPTQIEVEREEILRSVREALSYSDRHSVGPGILSFAGFDLVADVVPWAEERGFNVTEENGCAVFRTLNRP